jgi:large subunit ribosomal protein L23
VEAQHVLLGPVITEKGTALVEKHRQVAFKVALAASKHDIRTAVESSYGVTVNQVRTLIAASRVKRKGASIGRKPKWKKAIVTLKEGDAIDFYATE